MEADLLALRHRACDCAQAMGIRVEPDLLAAQRAASSDEALAPFSRRANARRVKTILISETFLSETIMSETAATAACNIPSVLDWWGHVRVAPRAARRGSGRFVRSNSRLSCRRLRRDFLFDFPSHGAVREIKVMP